MLRLEREDLDDPEKLRPIAETAGMTPEGFLERYGYLVGAPPGRSPSDGS